MNHSNTQDIESTPQYSTNSSNSPFQKHQKLEYGQNETALDETDNMIIHSLLVPIVVDIEIVESVVDKLSGINLMHATTMRGIVRGEEKVLLDKDDDAGDNLFCAIMVMFDAITISFALTLLMTN